jgi:hypothetical protein
MRRFLSGWRLWLILAVLAYTLIGFLLLPWIIERQLVAFGETRLERPLTVERVRLNPYALSLTVDGLRLDEQDGTPIGALEQLYVNFQATSLFRWAWTFKDLQLQGPYLNFVRYEDGSNNFERLARTMEETAEPATEPPEEETEDAGLPRLILQHFALAAGAVDFTDRSRPTDFSTEFEAIDFELFDLSTLPETEAGHTIRLVTETGAEIVWNGEVQPNPPRLSGRLEGRGERPRLIWRYVQDSVGFEVADGRVTLTLDVDLAVGDDGLRLAVDNIEYTLTDLLLRPKGGEQDVLSVPKLALSGGRLRLPEQTFHVEEARVEGARLVVERDEQGVVNVLDLLEPGNAAAGSVPGEVSAPDVLADPAAGAETPAGDSGPEAADAAPANDPAATSPAAPAAGGGDATDDTAPLSTEGDDSAPAEPQPAAAEADAPSADAPSADNPSVDAPATDDPSAKADDGTDEPPAAAGAEAQPATPDADTETADAPSATNDGETVGPPADADADADAGEGVTPESSPAGSDDSWLVTVASVVVEDLGVNFQDRSFSRPLATGIEGLRLGISDFSTEPGSEFRVDLETGVTTGGRLELAGVAGLEPLIARLDVDLQSLSIEPLETVISDQIRLRLLSGDVGVQGQVEHTPEEPLAFSGSASVDDLVTEDTILEERFVAWQSLSIPSIELTLAEQSLVMETVALQAPYAKFVIKDDGTTNISDILAAEPETEDAPETATPDDADADAAAGAGAGADAGETTLLVRVNNITIEEGSANFSDLSLPLPFATAIHSMKGAIGGVTSTGEGVATVDIDGQVDESGSADIAGELDPVAPTDHLKMDVVFKNVHMPRLTPYSAKFAGREIEGGKLSLDLRYRIDQGQLNSENNFLIERLELGDKVESPEAMNLPLDLAVALLQDSQGRIDIELPVTGDLNDPEFHYGAVVWKAVGNILLKAVTAPFKLLGALIPGGGKAEQLEFIEFEPGTATLSPTETVDLDEIAVAIGKRPQLQLKVPSAYSATTDKEGLQRVRLAEQVDERIATAGLAGAPDANRRALEQLYVETYSQTELDNLEAANTRVPEGGNDPVLDEEAYVAALSRSLRESESVTTADLEALAQARAQAITDYLLNTAGAPPAQLSQSPIKTVEPNEAGQVQLKFEVDAG